MTVYEIIGGCKEWPTQVHMNLATRVRYYCLEDDEINQKEPTLMSISEISPNETFTDMSAS